MCSLCSSWYIWILSAYLIFMSVYEAFLFAMCQQQQYDFLVISAVSTLDGIVLGACWGTEELGWNERSRKRLRDVR